VRNYLDCSFLSRNVKVKIDKNIILHVALHGCEIWSLTFREKRKLGMFENRVLRRIFWPKKVKVTGEWRILHNEELYVMYSTPNTIRVIKSRRIKLEGHVSRIWRGKETTWKTQA
jgi:hypothetical protein